MSLLVDNDQWLIPGPLHSLTADPGERSWIPVESHAFVEIDHKMVDTRSCSLTADPGVGRSSPMLLVQIDHEIISTAILLPSTVKKGCCQLHKVLVNHIASLLR